MLKNYDDNRNMSGSGWRDVVAKGIAATANAFPDSDENARPMFPSEFHAIGRCGNKPCLSNFTGPGTRIAARIRRGDPPRNKTDLVSKRHDAAYGLSSSPADIRAADERMLKSLRKLKKDKSDSKINTAPAYAGIAAKIKAEDYGILSKNAFISDEPVSAADRKLFQDTIEKIDQTGIGKKTERPGEKLLKHLGRHVLKTKRIKRRRKK